MVLDKFAEDPRASKADTVSGTHDLAEDEEEDKAQFPPHQNSVQGSCFTE